MSEPVMKPRSTIDLDEFERRLRHASSDARDEDPLAELARLVGEPYDPYGEVFAHEAASHSVAAGHPTQLALQHDGRLEPGLSGAGPRLFGDFAAIEAGLRGAIPTGADQREDFGRYHQADQGHYDTVSHQPYGEQVDAYGQGGDHAPGGFDPNWAEHRAEPVARMRRPVYIMAATIAVGVIGIGAAFALKGHVATSPGEIKTIMADAGPTKIQPPPDASSDAASSDANAFGKSGQTAPTKLVSREEQPVDIQQTVQDNAARARMTAAGGTDASSVPVPPSPGQVQTAMADPQTGSANRADPIGDQVQGFGLSDMPAPKRVRVVSVRPDGTILPNDQPPPAAIPVPRQATNKTSDRAGPVAKASTPKVATTKSTSRVTATPRTIESVAAGDDADPAPAATKPAKKAKPQRVASADPGRQEATDAVAPSPEATENAGGGFAVQLAAPGSEADAKATSSRLSKKFADALGDHRLGFRKADSNGKSVYRVRVGSLSKSDAVSLCEKLKADGGTCFVAKN